MRITSVGAAMETAAQANAEASPLRDRILGDIDYAIERSRSRPDKEKPVRRRTKPAGSGVAVLVKAVDKLSDTALAAMVAPLGPTSKSLTEWRHEFCNWLGAHPANADTTLPKAWGHFCYEQKLAGGDGGNTGTEATQAPPVAQAPARTVIPVNFTDAPPASEPMHRGTNIPAWVLRRMAARQAATAQVTA